MKTNCGRVGTRLCMSMALCCASFTATAVSLTPAEALARLDTAPALSPLSKVNAMPSELIFTGMTDNGKPAYYVFDTNTSVLFVGADDVAMPLLGYIDGVFDPDIIPPAMEWLLGEYCRQVELAVTNGLAPAVITPLADDGREPIAPLLRTQWSQSAPYNNLCPERKGETTYTGCVATSVAQVMNYHQYPDKGIGEVSYNWYGQTLSLDMSAVTFSWSDMLDTYPDASTGTAAQRDAIATLMRACGYALNMTYGNSEDGGSSAYDSMIYPALVNNFGYDKGMHNERAVFFSPQEWSDMIYTNLRDCGPVIYGGRNDGGGHSFVCDGYDGKGLFHINWGWNGLSDGYFLLSALDPSSQGDGGTLDGYNDGQQAVLGIRPPVDGSVPPQPYIGFLSELYAISNGRTITLQPQTVSVVDRFINFGSEAATFSLGVSVDGENGDAPLYMTVFKDMVIEPNDGRGWIDVTLPSELLDGRYRITPVYRLGTGDWTPVRLPWDAPRYIGMEIIGGTVVIDPVNRPYNLCVTECDCRTLTLGEPFVITAKIYNSSDKDVTATIDCDLKDLSDPDDYIGLSYLLMLEPATVTVPAKGYAEIRYEDVMPDDGWTGDFTMEFYDTKYVYGRFPVVVGEQAAVSLPAADDAATDVRCYDLLGRPVSPEYDGLHIRITDGKAQKVF